MFIDPPEENEAVTQLYEADREHDGFVMNLTRIWAWRPGVTAAFLDARKRLMAETRLSQRELAVLVCAMARSLGDSYCSLAWGATSLASLMNRSRPSY